MTTSDLRILSVSEINESLSRLEGWSIEDNGRAIEKNLSFKNFKEAIAFINKMAEIAEREGHHPDLNLYGYNNLRIKLTTHSVSGLTSKDFGIAEKIDSI
jgi:4a-hydroxytetrahydrobiopterin dehydratase